MVHRSVSVDWKHFGFSWEVNRNARECFQIEETWNGRMFKASCSFEGGKWLGGLLVRLGEGMMFRRLPRFVNGGDEIRVVRRGNVRGDFIQVVFLRKGSMGVPMVICFPQGVRGRHWRLIGKVLERMLVIERVTQPVRHIQNPVRSDGRVIEEQRSKEVAQPGFLVGTAPVIISGWPKPYMSWEHSSSTVEVLSKGTTFCETRWSSAVLCSCLYDSDSWDRVEKCVTERFDVKEFRRISEKAMMIFMFTEEDAARLYLLKTLTLGAVEFSFKGWSPEMGCVKFEKDMDWWVSLVGFPFHLKNVDCINSIAGVLGDLKEVDLNSFALESSVVRVKIGRSSCDDLPRRIHVKEFGNVFSISIMIEQPFFDWECGGSDGISVVSTVVPSERVGESSHVVAREGQERRVEGLESNYIETIVINEIGVSQVPLTVENQILHVGDIQILNVGEDRGGLDHGGGPEIEEIGLISGVNIEPMDLIIQNEEVSGSFLVSNTCEDEEREEEAADGLDGYDRGVGLSTFGPSRVVERFSAHIESGLLIGRKSRAKKANSWEGVFAKSLSKSVFAVKCKGRRKNNHKISSYGKSQKGAQYLVSNSSGGGGFLNNKKDILDENLGDVQNQGGSDLCEMYDVEIPPGFGKKKQQCESRTNLLAGIRSCNSEEEIGSWTKHIAIPLAPLIGVSRRFDGTYGEKDFLNLVVEQRKLVGASKHF
ncbi:hypothetical protein FRX31_005210 [Thalictrum thalictroides]|uniref:DUF4283 domain-containing protein n=1 Tax=Thalictrum thalictroides TaxID=46969 RepID=A0A7J6X725_THATH|nr:hypothetical protein FRX31_005210 [Thalictrum thalictroides]